jgi:uncharacterized membrane protein YdjX (TVP38/TMEM64 family)
MRKWMMTVVVMSAATLLLFYRHEISDWMRDDSLTGPQELLVLLAAFAFALIPALPYSIAAAIIGAKYGPAAGTLLNLVISSSAAWALFALVRYGFTPEQRRKAAGIKRVARLTVLFERSPFLAVLFARLLPIVPAQAVTIYSAVTQIRVWPYVLATVAGKIPFLLTVTVVGEQLLLLSDWRYASGVILIYGCFVGGVMVLYRWFWRTR